MAIKTVNIQCRTTDEVKEIFTKKAILVDYSNLTEYMLFVGIKYRNTSFY